VKEEDFTWTNKGEEAEREEGVMVELEGGLGGEEEVEVFDGDPELRTGTVVDVVVRAKSIRGEGGEGRGIPFIRHQNLMAEVVEFAFPKENPSEKQKKMKEWRELGERGGRERESQYLMYWLKWEE